MNSPQTKQIKILIVDDHPMVRKGLAAFIFSDKEMTLVGEACDGEQAVKLCEEHQPDVILMDLVMPRMDGIVATNIIKKKYPHIQIIALTSFTEQGLIHKALQAGATGYLLKNIKADELAKAVRMANSGLFALAPEAAELFIAKQINISPQVNDHQLSVREAEVLDLLSDGKNNREIAETLQIELSTVKAHVSHILSKLGLSSRAEAISYVLKTPRHDIDSENH
jgi:two-component system, NarL family, response regulator LiaR